MIALIHTRVWVWSRICVHADVRDRAYGYTVGMIPRRFTYTFGRTCACICGYSVGTALT